MSAPPEIETAAPAGTRNDEASRPSHLTAAYINPSKTVNRKAPAAGDKAIAYKAATICPGLSGAAGKVLGALIDAANNRTGRCNPSVAELARRLPGLAHRSIKRATQELSNADLQYGRPALLTKVRTRGTSYFNIDWAALASIVETYDRSVRRAAAHKELPELASSGQSTGAKNGPSEGPTLTPYHASKGPNLAHGTHVKNLTHENEPITLSPPTPSRQSNRCRRERNRQFERSRSDRSGRTDQ